ncbi:uncharacterized protein KIAA1958-like [Acropora muricata]|uniref:uncharacterized protein KIAA1958-like n=1 Tax=Acropora muricata TaxID=159855 RepID=UPI0034E3971C
MSEKDSVRLSEVRELDNISAGSLNVLLCKFFMDVKKKDGGDYEPASLSSCQKSIRRYLKDKNSSFNLFQDMKFAKSREVLLSKKREVIEKHAEGNRPQAVGSVTSSEQDLLFHTKQFGDHDPEVLQRTVWWVLSLHFGFRARDESRKLRWGAMVLENDPHGCEVLVWKAERGSKTRHGGGTHQRAFNLTVQATNKERCPVKLFKKFSAHRPEKMKHPDSPFFLAINHKRKQESQIWYCNSPLGKNAIGKFLVNAAKAAGLPGNISNHSVRKTCISRLMVDDLPENYEAQLSGHKNLKSLDAYKSASQGHQRRMSMVLKRSTASSSAGNSEIKQPRCLKCRFKGKKHQLRGPKGFFQEQQLASLKVVPLISTCRLERCVQKMAKQRGHPKERNASRSSVMTPFLIKDETLLVNFSVKIRV